MELTKTLGLRSLVRVALASIQTNRVSTLYLVLINSYYFLGQSYKADTNGPIFILFTRYLKQMRMPLNEDNGVRDLSQSVQIIS